MPTELSAFLGRHAPRAEETVVWQPSGFARHADGYEIEAVFRPIRVVLPLDLSPIQSAFLRAAVDAMSEGSHRQ